MVFSFIILCWNQLKLQQSIHFSVVAFGNEWQWADHRNKFAHEFCLHEFDLKFYFMFKSCFHGVAVLDPATSTVVELAERNLGRDLRLECLAEDLASYLAEVPSLSVVEFAVEQQLVLHDRLVPYL